MNNLKSIRGKPWHGHMDSENYCPFLRSGENRKTKYVIFQERDLNYNFHLHRHPFVQKLTQSLVGEGVAGMQALDTINSSDKPTLPFSVEVALVREEENIKICSNSRIAFLENVKASYDGKIIDISKDKECKIVRDASAKAPEGMKATLVEGITGTQSTDCVLGMPFTGVAVVWEDIEITLIQETEVTLFDGTKVKLPTDTKVLLACGSQVTFMVKTPVKIIKSKPRPELFTDFFDALYKPNPALVRHPYPVEDLDFASGGAYSVYNWELFFHAPLSIAIHLSKNQRFAEAQRWFHYLFDPTDDSDGPTPERFWKVRPFQYTDVKKIEEILVNLVTGSDEALWEETIRSFEEWMDKPFRPHVVARFRQQAYMYKTVMAYLDNLIAWGDSLFRQDTGEAIDEAMQAYVMAANILGPRPQPVPKKGTVRPQTYSNLRQDLKQFGTVMRQMEPNLPFDLMPFPSDKTGDNAQLATLRNMGNALYFCVPRNDKLLSYWDTVADRLFKIRNSLNIQGIFRQLALFEPPIDPALLARAAAAGLDMGAIVNGRNQPLPLVRFQLLAQKAAEIVQEVKSLGNNLLSAMEKEDGEALAILRAKHERVVMEMVEHVKYAQLQEAIKSKEGLLKSLALAKQRYTYYERQLNKSQEDIDKAIPELKELDEQEKDSLSKMNFSTQEPEMGVRDIEVDIATDILAQAAKLGYGGKIMSSHEVREALLLEGAQLASDLVNVLNIASSIGHVVPSFFVVAAPMGVGAITEYGGKDIGWTIGSTAAAARAVADRMNFEARRAGRIDSFARREQEWLFQSNLAAGEITQIFKQLRAAQIREAIAEKEWKNHQQQIKQAQEIEFFLTGEKSSDWTQKIDPTEKKTTNRAFYAWMKREVKGLYAQCFQFAFDVAKKAERALQHELGNPELNYIQFGYLAGKEGLLAGEKLHLDLKRMEMAYLDLNQREYELTKHVSLLQIDPLALIQLRTTGRCTARLPEELFDMDGPGHYFRRIKSVSVSIPCVTGTYTSVNCTLTLLKSSIRKTPNLRDGAYAREDSEDDRFSDYFGSLQSIVTSTAQNDSGLFETNLRDERYLPFENSGVISEWQIALPANPSKKEPTQFDYDTISDVILHIRYTAREGGELIRQRAMLNLTGQIEAAEHAGSVRLFNIRYEFPNEWVKFRGSAAENEWYRLSLTLREEHYPFWSRHRLESIQELNIIAKTDKSSLMVANNTETSPSGNQDKMDKLQKDVSLGGLCVGKLSKISPPPPTSTEKEPFTLYFSDKTMVDLWMAVRWGNAK